MNMNNDATEFGLIVHRNLRRKKVGLGPLRLLSFLGITMGVLILMAMAAPSARAALETYYDFEDGNFTSDSPGLQPTSIGAATGTFTFPALTGTTVNAVTPITTNTALTLHPVSHGLGEFALGGLTTTGLTDVHLSFALLSAATGGSFTDLSLEYSTTGVSGPYNPPFASVTKLAKLILDALASLELQAFVKTSGASGIHIFLPVEPRYTHEQARMLLQAVASIVDQKNPGLITPSPVRRTTPARPNASRPSGRHRTAYSGSRFHRGRSPRARIRIGG